MHYQKRLLQDIERNIVEEVQKKQTFVDEIEREKSKKTNAYEELTNKGKMNSSFFSQLFNEPYVLDLEEKIKELEKKILTLKTEYQKERKKKDLIIERYQSKEKERLKGQRMKEEYMLQDHFQMKKETNSGGDVDENRDGDYGYDEPSFWEI